MVRRERGTSLPRIPEILKRTHTETLGEKYVIDLLCVIGTGLVRPHNNSNSTKNTKRRKNLFAFLDAMLFFYLFQLLSPELVHFIIELGALGIFGQKQQLKHSFFLFFGVFFLFFATVVVACSNTIILIILDVLAPEWSTFKECWINCTAAAAPRL